jgi:Pentapeptide repeats (8 copies)/Tetratricopeptide repeat
MHAPFRVWSLSFGLLLAGAISPAWSADANQLMRLLESRSCQGCRLQDADLVQADLRDAKLKGAQLQRANLSGARLDGADLRGTNLSFTSLAGASLRGTDLRGTNLNGTDLRQADLSDALLDPGSLSRTHWQQAIGINPSQHSYAELHNAGVAAAQQGRYPEAERFFGEAIRQQPDAPISWVARAICRREQGKIELAAQDLAHASDLHQMMGEKVQADDLAAASKELLEPSKKPKGGNGLGQQIVQGALAAFQVLGPIAIKAMVPLAP